MATSSNNKPQNAHLMDDYFTFDVYKVYLYDVDTNTELFTDTLTDSSLKFAESLKDVRAGVGNVLLTQIPTNKDASIEITDVKTRLDWIAAKQGTDVQVGKKNAYHMPRIYVAEKGSTGTDVDINLEAAPTTLADVRFIKQKADGSTIELTSTPTASGTKVTFSGGTGDQVLAEGDKIWVTGYVYETDSTASYITFDSEKFAKAFRVVVEGLIYNSKKKPVFKKQYIFHQMSIDGSFEDSTKSERDAQANKTTLKAQLAAGETELGYMVLIPVGAKAVTP